MSDLVSGVGYLLKLGIDILGFAGSFSSSTTDKADVVAAKKIPKADLTKANSSSSGKKASSSKVEKKEVSFEMKELSDKNKSKKSSLVSESPLSSPENRDQGASKEFEDTLLKMEGGQDDNSPIPHSNPSSKPSVLEKAINQTLPAGSGSIPDDDDSADDSLIDKPSDTEKPISLWSRMSDGTITTYQLGDAEKVEYGKKLTAVQDAIRVALSEGPEKTHLPEEADLKSFAILDFATRQASYSGKDGVTYELDLREFCKEEGSGVEKAMQDLIKIYGEVRGKSIIDKWASERNIIVEDVKLNAERPSYKIIGSLDWKELPPEVVMRLKNNEECIEKIRVMDSKILNTPSFLLSNAAEGCHMQTLSKCSEALRTEEKTTRTWREAVRWDKEKEKTNPYVENQKRREALVEQAKSVARETWQDPIRELLQKKIGEEGSDFLLKQLTNLKKLINESGSDDQKKLAKSIVDAENPTEGEKAVQKQLNWIKKQIIEVNYRKDSTAKDKDAELAKTEYLGEISKEFPFIMDLEALDEDSIKNFKSQSFVVNEEDYKALDSSGKQGRQENGKESFRSSAEACIKKIADLYDKQYQEQSAKVTVDAAYAKQVKDQYLLDCLGFLAPKGDLASDLLHVYSKEYVIAHPGTRIRTQAVQDLARKFREMEPSKTGNTTDGKKEFPVNLEVLKAEDLNELDWEWFELDLRLAAGETDKVAQAARQSKITAIDDTVKALNKLLWVVSSRDEEGKALRASINEVIKEEWRIRNGATTKTNKDYDELIGKIKKCESLINSEYGRGLRSAIGLGSKYTLVEKYNDCLTRFNVEREKDLKSSSCSANLELLEKKVEDGDSRDRVDSVESELSASSGDEVPLL